MRQKPWHFAALALLAACGPATPRAGVPLGDQVAQAVFETRTNGTDLLRVHVIYPAQPDGTPKTGPFPALVYVQGGFVPTERYFWQAEFLARQGYVVALPEHTLQLAFFGIENGLAAQQLLVNPPPSWLSGLVDPTRIAVAGHSLGGVVATKLALAGSFRALAVQASFSDAADDAKLPGLGMPSLFLAGASDCQAKLTQVQTGWAKMPSPTALVVVPGMTHFGFTNTDQDDAKRCPPQATLADSHARIEGAMTAFLHAALGADGSVGEAALRQVDGVEVSTR